MKMNLKGWKKVAAEKTHTILRNSHGHELKIAHKSLSPDNKAALDSLPHFYGGGDLNPFDYAANQVAIKPKSSGSGKDAEPESESSSSGNSGTVRVINSDANPTPDVDKPNYANAAVEPADPNYDQGGQVTPPQPKSTPKPNPIGYPSGASLAKGGMVRHYDEGSPDTVQPAPQGQATTPPDQGLDAASQNLQSMGQPGLAAPAPQPGDDAQPITQAQANQVKPSPYDAQALGEQKAQSALAVGKDEAAGSTAQAGALQAGQESLHPEKQQAIYTALQDTEMKSQKEFQDRYTEYKKALETPVDPNRYLNNLKADTGRSILNTIGLVLGGIGQGLGAGPNPALAMMNSAIDRDVQAQKNALGNKETLYSSALDKYKNDRMATTEARHQLMYNAVQQMQEAALKSGSKLAVDRAQGLAADAYNAELPSVQSQNMMKVMNQVTSEGGDVHQVLPYLDVANPAAAKSIRDRMIPGVKGLANINVPDASRDEITSKQNLIDGALKLKQFIDQNSVSGKLDPSKRGYLAARATELEQTYRKAVGASTSEGEAKKLQTIVGDNPSALFASETYSPRLQGMVDATKEQLGGKYKQFGVDSKAIPSQYQVQEQAAAQPAALPPGAQNMIKFAQNVLKTSSDPKAIAGAQRVLKIHNIQ